jgi:DNA-binding NarL/FixJ family response regulator
MVRRITRIVIVDDHPVVRAGLRALLADDSSVDVDVDFEVVGEAADGREAIDLVDRVAPHVVLMDFQMPVLDGVAATRAITRKHSGIRVLVLMTFETKSDVARAIAAGAVGCVAKDAPRGAITAAIHAAALLCP